MTSDPAAIADADLAFYRAHIAPLLPPVILDVHAHTWRSAHWRQIAWETDAPGGAYMVTRPDYDHHALQADARTLFPDRPYHAVCFGYPTPLADLDQTNDYTAALGQQPGRYPLFITGRGLHPLAIIEERLRTQRFFGYKIFLPWLGDDYGAITLPDMLGHPEMALAHRLRLLVLLHLPGLRRLADPALQADLRRYAGDYPHAQFILAHCGRCYLPDELAAAIPAIADLPNVYLDTAMVMDPTVLQIALEQLGSSRLLFGTDLPVANMRGRRVYAADHWIDLVLDGHGYALSAFRAITPHMHATFMTYEIILALHRATQRLHLPPSHLAAILHDNSYHLLAAVMDGAHLARA